MSRGKIRKGNRFNIKKGKGIQRKKRESKWGWEMNRKQTKSNLY